ncbi:hypothetical protein C8Q78DRAFT_1148116 [Trametes maxima]|nr:hypothetical protein C8Q78DRAFT_1148116 [Trametes maxima]
MSESSPESSYAFPPAPTANAGAQDTPKTAFKDAIFEWVLNKLDGQGEKPWASGNEPSKEALRVLFERSLDEVLMGTRFNGNHQAYHGGYSSGPHTIPPPPRPIPVDPAGSSLTSRGTLNDVDLNRVTQAGQGGEAPPVVQNYDIVAPDIHYHVGQEVDLSSFSLPTPDYYHVPGPPNTTFGPAFPVPGSHNTASTVTSPLVAAGPIVAATTVAPTAPPTMPTTTIPTPRAGSSAVVSPQQYSYHHQISGRRFPVDVTVRVDDGHGAIWRLCTLMRCRIPGCDYVGPGDTLGDHFKSHYKRPAMQDVLTCAWYGCGKKVKKIGELKRHLEDKHLTVRNWHCSTCHTTVRVDDKRGAHPAPGKCGYKGTTLDHTAGGSKKTECRECLQFPPKLAKELTVEVAFTHGKAKVLRERGVHSKDCWSYSHKGPCGS